MTRPATTAGWSVVFAAISLVVNKLVYGEYALTRSFELYFTHAVQQAASFRKDVLFDALQYNPYLLPHRLAAILLDTTSISPDALMIIAYAAVEIVLMFAYLHLSQAMFKRASVPPLVLFLIAMKFSPFTFGSAIELNLATLTPNLVAIVFEVLALSFFLSDRWTAAAAAMTVALYAHVLSAMFVVIACGSYAIVYRRDAGVREVVTAAVIVCLGSLPLIGALVFVAVRNASALEPWQLVSAVSAAWGHVSLRIWSVKDPIRLAVFALTACGFVFAVATDRALYRNDEIRRRVVFMSGAAVVVVVAGGTLSDYSATIAALQQLKIAWFLQLFMGLFAAALFVEVLLGGQSYRSIPAVATTTLLFAMHASHVGGAALAAAVGGLILLIYASGQVGWPVERPRVMAAACALLVVLLVAGPYVTGRAEARNRTDGPPIAEVVDAEWKDAMQAIDQLPSDAYILYPFTRHTEYFALARRPGFFNLEYVSFLTLRGKLPAVDRYVVDLLHVDTNVDPPIAYADAWARLSAADVLAIRRAYGITHVLCERRRIAFDFPVVYDNREYVIYDVAAAQTDAARVHQPLGVDIAHR